MLRGIDDQIRNISGDAQLGFTWGRLLLAGQLSLLVIAAWTQDFDGRYRSIVRRGAENTAAATAVKTVRPLRCK